MRTGTLVRRSLVHYWRSNLAVIAGSAIAVSVLAGASMVGDSVRASLRDMLLRRLGNTHAVIASTGFFSEKLAGSFDNSCPLISLEGLVTSGDRRASEVAVYGVDERFWKFHARAGEAAAERTAMLSESVASEIAAKPGDSILVRVEKPSAIPAESLHGRKEDSARTLRLTFREGNAEFSFRPGQSAVRAVFVPLERLQRDLDQTGRVNTILTTSGDTAQLAQILKARATLEDIGVRIRDLGPSLSLEAEGALITGGLTQSTVTVAKDLQINAAPVLTYLANTIRAGDREIPYSLVTAIDLPEFQNAPANAILLNEWAAQDLGAKPGAPVRLDYYVWKEEGRLASESADFQVAGVLPIRGIAADRDLTPSYPGMTGAKTLHDWDPPFPVDLKRVRPRDEDYWKRYRTTPKAFIRLERGQQLWQSRFGKLTSIRLSPSNPQFAVRLRDALDPLQNGFLIQATRTEGLKAAAGSTDFGEYFLYFSFFLVVSAMLLIGLFFKLNIEQRLREIGILRAVGFPPRRLMSVFLREGLALAVAGGLIGVAGAIAYASFIVFGLRTWW
ncbi:MAG: ABC transporter permease, partial [Bryobacteraceae bacterium]